jgi:protein pelota
MLTLTLLIVDIDYFSEGDRLAISIKGRNAEQNDYLKIGQYHTFCVDLDTKITIFKQCWSQYEINLVK